MGNFNGGGSGLGSVIGSNKANIDHPNITHKYYDARTVYICD